MENRHGGQRTERRLCTHCRQPEWKLWFVFSGVPSRPDVVFCLALPSLPIPSDTLHQASIFTASQAACKLIRAGARELAREPIVIE